MASKDPAKTDQDPPKGGSSDSVVLHWLGDESVFVSGVPNRDITEADALSAEDLKRAVEHGTHSKKGS